jgi:hypothetical protein
LLGSRFLIMQQLHYNNRGAVFSAYILWDWNWIKKSLWKKSPACSTIYPENHFDLHRVLKQNLIPLFWWRSDLRTPKNVSNRERTKASLVLRNWRPAVWFCDVWELCCSYQSSEICTSISQTHLHQTHRGAFGETSFKSSPDR